MLFSHVFAPSVTNKGVPYKKIIYMQSITLYIGTLKCISEIISQAIIKEKKIFTPLKRFSEGYFRESGYHLPPHTTIVTV